MTKHLTDCMLLVTSFSACSYNEKGEQREAT